MSENEFLDEDESYDVSLYASIERNLRSYSGFLSLLRELIQNSDDSSKDKKDVEVSINFKENVLIFKNNTIFSNDDWDNIRYIGSRGKDNDPEKTGRFGIGFTAIFKICDICEIHSKNKSKKLDLNTKSSNKWRTYSDPRFKDENITQFEFFWRFEKSYACKEINAEVLNPTIITDYLKETVKSIHEGIHFLQNITKIYIYHNDIIQQKIEISRIKSQNLTPEIEKHITTISINKKNLKEYIIYSENIKSYFVKEYNEGTARKDKLLLSIAIDKVESIEGRLFCTLPTELASGFAFDINSDFQPDPNRKQLIFAKGDPKGEYNIKLLSFVPKLFYEIIDDLKNILPTKLFYKIISSEIYSIKELKNLRLYSDFVKLIHDGDEIIFINKKWNSIRNSKYITLSPLLSFLERIKHPIISEEIIEFKNFFQLIGVTEFNISDLINLIQKEIPSSVLFNESVFESKEELKSVFNYLQSFDNIHKTHNTQSLNIFLTESGVLYNTNNIQIYEVNNSLSLIKNDLSIYIIDDDLFKDFGDLLIKLGVKKFSSDDLINILINDFPEKSYPIKLPTKKPYINSIEKLKLIINFIDNYLKKSSEFKIDPSKTIYDQHGKVITPQTEKYRIQKSFYDKFDKLPIVLSEDNQLYSLEYVPYNLDSDIKKSFALKYNIKDIAINPEIKKLLSKYSLFKDLDLKTIFNFVKTDTKGFSNEFLTLLYELIKDGESQLNSTVKSIIKTMPIFRNNKGGPCSLENNGKVMKLRGNYSDPIGVKEILDEKLINSVPGFKENILIRYFEIKELNFEIYIKEYFKEIFDKEEIDREKKLQLVEELNVQFLKLESCKSFGEIKEILKKTKLVYCQDNKFHYLHENNLFFRSEEMDKFYGKDYLYPNFSENKKYQHLLEELGLNKELKPHQIVDYIKKLIDSKKVDIKLIEKLINILMYINKRWESFEDKETFKKLADLEWLPASHDKLKLYKPSNLYTQDTIPYLANLNGIFYLDLKTSIRNIETILRIISVSKIPIDQIIDNLRIASEKAKKLENPMKIYGELNERIRHNKVDKSKIQKLKEFPSVYIKYKCEDNYRYFYFFEVFTKDCQNEYGFEYIGYLEPEFAKGCKELVELLAILREPTKDTIKHILEKIDSKYKNTKYSITSDIDKKIIETCKKQLSKSIDDIDSAFISELQKLHIFCNSKDKLITPEDTILNDRPSLYNEFKDGLEYNFIIYQKEYSDILDKLEIKKLSQLINKDLEVEPYLNQLIINENLSNKLRNLSKLMRRIKAGRYSEENKWKDIDFRITVYNFDKLRVLKYVEWNDIKYYSNKKKINCYIQKDDNSLVKIFVMGSIEDINKSLIQEIFEEINPDISPEFKILIGSLLQKESYSDMNEILTELDFPDVREVGDTSLDSNIQIFDKEQDVEKNNWSDASETGLERHKTDGSEKSDEYPSQSDKKLENQPIIIKNSDSKEIKKGRTISPTTETNFKKEIIQGISKPVAHHNADDFNGIEENIEPLSLEEIQNFKSEIKKEINTEIENIQSDNKNREYKQRLEQLKDDVLAKSEVELWYNNKCQICGYTFRKRNGTNHSKKIYLLPKRNKGIRYDSNVVCLCPNHAAIIEEGRIKIHLDDLKENKVTVEVEDVFIDKYSNYIYEIKYHPAHFLMLKSMLEYPSELGSREESVNISEKTNIVDTSDPIPLLTKAFDMVVEENGEALLSRMGIKLLELDSSFDPRNYNHKSKKLSELIKAHPNIFKLGFENKRVIRLS